MHSSHAYFAEKLHHNLKGGLGTSDDAVVRVVVSHSEVSGPVLGYVWIPACDTCMFEYMYLLLVIIVWFLFH